MVLPFDLTTMHEDAVNLNETEDQTMDVRLQRVEPCSKGLVVTQEVRGRHIENGGN